MFFYEISNQNKIVVAHIVFQSYGVLCLRKLFYQFVKLML